MVPSKTVRKINTFCETMQTAADWYTLYEPRLPNTPDQPRAPLGASQTSRSSPLTSDVSQVALTRLRGQNAFLLF